MLVLGGLGSLACGRSLGSVIPTLHRDRHLIAESSVCVSLSFESSGVGFSVFTGRWVVTWLGAQVADISDTTVDDFSAPVC